MQNARLTSGWHLTVSGSLFCVCSILHAQSLDDQLFEDLQDPVPAQETRSADDVAREQFKQELQRELGGPNAGGEDVGQRGESLLSKTADAMRRVRDRLAAKDTAAETRQMQKSIVSSLDQLIERMQKQQQKNSGGGKQPQQQGKPKAGQEQQQSQSKPGQGQANSSNQSAKQSSTRLGKAEAVQGEAMPRDKMMQESWGNLPASVRQQMQSASPEKFLPKYERLIEEYFLRLSEEDK